MRTRTSVEALDLDTPDRRSMLRRGGVTLAAGVAGLAVAGTVGAGDAEAAAGGNLVLGNANDAGSAQTKLTSTVGDSASTPGTLSLVNTGGGAPLHLESQAKPAFPGLSAANGNLANFGGDIYSATQFDTEAAYGFVYNEYTANQLVPIKLTRILDTRTAAGRANIINASGNLDSTGRLLNTHTIRISLANYVVAPVAVYANLTAVYPLSGGYLELFSGGTRPVASTLSFTANTVLANFAVTGAAVDSTSTSTEEIDSVSIFTLGTTHVLLDVIAFTVGSPIQVNPQYIPSNVTSATEAARRLQARVKAGATPSWYTGR